MIQPRNIANDFKKIVAGKSLSHAYLFFGPNLSESRTSALSLASFLETGCWKDESLNLTDAKILDGAAMKLGIEPVRESIDFLYRHPLASSRRTLVILRADELTDQAQNALLKVAEDPPEHALILIALRDASLLLPALASRLEKIFVGSSGAATGDNDLQVEARAHALEFLKAPMKQRSDLIKKLVEHDGDEEIEKKDKIIDTFLDELVREVSKRPEAHAQLLREILKRQTAMRDFSTNRRIQLEAVSQMLK